MSQKKTNNQFSIRQLVSAYNSYYKFANFKKTPKLSFREYKKEIIKDPAKDVIRESRKIIIKLSEFEAVYNFEKAYKNGIANEMNVKEEITKGSKGSNVIKTKMSDIEYLNYLIENHVYDIHLRSCLNIAATGFKSNPKPKKTDDETEQHPLNVYYELLVPQLGFVPRKEIEAKDYIQSIREYFEGDALRIKGFNKAFPHSVRNGDKEQKGINYFFLQRLVPNYNDVLEAIVVKKQEDTEIIAKCQADLAKKYSRLNKKQAADPVITENVLNKVKDTKWISKLIDVSDKKKEKTISKDVQEDIHKLVHDLLSTKAFIEVVRRSVEAAKDEDEIKTAYEEFNKMCSELDSFNRRHKTIDNTFESFAKYIVDANFILKDTFGITVPLKLIASSIKNKVEFKFTRKLKEKFDELIKAHVEKMNGSEKAKEEEKAHIDNLVKEIAEYCKNNSSAISVVKGYDFLDKSLEIYSNIGRCIDVPLPKNYRVALGIAIVKWINEKIEKFASENKKRESLIIDFKQ